jgi:hypothetical protein
VLGSSQAEPARPGARFFLTLIPWLLKDARPNQSLSSAGVHQADGAGSLPALGQDRAAPAQVAIPRALSAATGSVNVGEHQHIADAAEQSGGAECTATRGERGGELGALEGDGSFGRAACPGSGLEQIPGDLTHYFSVIPGNTIGNEQRPWSFVVPRGLVSPVQYAHLHLPVRAADAHPHGAVPRRAFSCHAARPSRNQPRRSAVSKQAT